MKHCPTCNANFVDEELAYCTDDGTLLVDSATTVVPESQETRVFPEPPVTRVMSPPSPTDYGLGNAQPVPPVPPEPYRWASEPPPAAAWKPPPPPAYPISNQQQQTVAILALVFGIAGITFGWICGGPILGLLAVILGLVALSQIKRDSTKYGGRPMAVGGIVTGGLVLLINLALLAFWILMLVIGSMSH